MVLTSIEIIAMLVAVLSIIKIVLVIFNRKMWYNNVVRPIYGNVNVSTPIFLLLAVIVFWYIFQFASLVFIFAVAGFIALIMAFGFMIYVKELTPILKKVYDKKINGWIMIYALIWLILSVGVLLEIFR